MLLRKNMKIMPFSRIDKFSVFEGGSYIGRNSIILRTTIGRHSYVGSNCVFSNTTIGRFCSISSNVQIVTGKHPTSIFVSTHPVFYSSTHASGKSFVSKTIFEEFAFTKNGKNVEIGNDGWIGRKVLIMGGVRIRDGAYIAAGSIVTKDIEPYSIVGGVPAKNIRKRFLDDECDKLLQLKWWNWSEDKIQSYVYLFSDIKSFLKNTDCY